MTDRLKKCQMNWLGYVIVGFVLMIGLLVTENPCFAAKTRDIGVVAKTSKGEPQNVHLYDYTAALIIGIDRYENLGSRHHLSYAVKDAKGVKKVLRENYQFARIKTLFNEQATRENIMEALYGFRSLSPESAGLADASLMTQTKSCPCPRQGKKLNIMPGW